VLDNGPMALSIESVNDGARLLLQENSGMNKNSKPTLTFAGAAIYVDDVQTVLDFYRRAFGFETRFFDASLEYGELDTGAICLAIASHKTGETLMPGRYRPAVKEPGAVESHFSRKTCLRPLSEQ
jgi:hypothetical protein